MAAVRESLHDAHPRRLDIPVLVACSTCLLVAGQLLPIVTVDPLGPSRSTYSILTGISDLLSGGNIVIGLIILVFSVLFPAVKLVALFALWFRKMRAEDRSRNLALLKKLGKWSMLDVFVVVVLVGTVRLGILAESEVEPGIYVFAVSILLSLVTTFLMARVAGTDVPRSAPREDRERAALKPVEATLALAALGLFVAGLAVPIMHVEEWVFWERDYSLLRGTWELFVEGEVFLGALVVAFVILLPLVSFGSLAVLSLFPATRGSNGEGAGWLHHLSKWSMLDVFGLATAVVVVKIGGLADVSARIGLWLFLGAAALSAYLSWRLDRTDGPHGIAG